VKDKKKKRHMAYSDSFIINDGIAGISMRHWVFASAYDLTSSHSVWTFEWNIISIGCTYLAELTFTHPLLLSASLYTLSTLCSNQSITILSDTLMDIYSNYPQFTPFYFLCVVD
jgi:hypothetical protein